MEYFIEENMKSHFKFGTNPLQKILQKVQFDYFHSDMHTYGGIYPSAKLPEKDPNLLYVSGKRPAREFANKAAFFRCCLRVSAQPQNLKK